MQLLDKQLHFLSVFEPCFAEDPRSLNAVQGNNRLTAGAGYAFVYYKILLTIIFY